MEDRSTHPRFGSTPPEGVDPLSFAVFRALMRTIKLNGRLLMRTLGQKGGHPGQAGCLWALGAHEGISQRELGEALQLSPPTVTAMLQKMERAGFVRRAADEDDQRVMRLHLTDAGREMNGALRAAHGEYISNTIGSMSAKDRRELTRLLGVLSDNIAAALERTESAGGEGDVVA